MIAILGQLGVLLGIVLFLFGALYGSPDLVSKGLLLFFGGGIFSAIAFVLISMEESGVEVPSMSKLLKYLHDNRRPPDTLSREVDRFEKLAPNALNISDKARNIRTRVRHYPVLKNRVDEIERKVNIPRSVEKHKSQIELNLNRSIKKDDYGTILEDRRSSEIRRFLESMGLLGVEPSEISRNIDLVRDTLNKLRAEEEQQGFDPSRAPEDGLEFESWVAKSLDTMGWETINTKGSGDQGVDVIASKGGIKAGIQCKRYKNNVPISAIQQSYSAKSHFNLTHAIVVATSGYTKSAKEVAETNGVLLLNHYDLPKLREKILEHDS